jgi:mycothiol conjugate amidase Mca
MPERHSLMTVHAHPDDETISTGGVMSLYANAGHRVICVTSTGGEHGEIVVPEMDTPENHARLAEIRRDEIARALAHLGPIEHHWLGYIDSGMMGTPENDGEGSFWQADQDEAAGRLVRLIRQTRPQVLVSYNDFGGYGHPDHLRAATTTKRAFESAGDPTAYPEHLREGLEPWQPLKLYETVFDMSRREEMARIMEERGIPNWWTPDENESDEQRAGREALMTQMRDATGPRTTSVDVTSALEAKQAAMREHVSQFAADSWFLALTIDDWRTIAPTEDFTLRASTVGVRIPEDDLFAGLPVEP